MSIKLANFQQLWGIAGAREKFEDMVSLLIHAECPDSRRIRIVKGDGGLDSFEGEFGDPDGIDVFQCKYFPCRIEDSQKGQIRESFATVRNSTRFKAKSWTLCLPLDMSLDETEWFEGWKAKQVDSGIEIRQPWGAHPIEHLLLQEKNRSIRESFFREENTGLLREQVGILNELKQQGLRNLMVRITPVWNRRRLQAQIQLFNSGKGAIYITGWWTQWGPAGKKGARHSGETTRGTLPLRLEEHEAGELLIHVDCEVEDLTGIGVVDGTQHLWLATDKNLVIFKHDAIFHRLPPADEPVDVQSTLERSEVDAKARARRLAGTDHDQLEIVITNQSARTLSVDHVLLSWKYTPPRQKPKFPGEPSVEEIEGSVGLSRHSTKNEIDPGNQVVFVLERDMAVLLIEVARGDVLDEDIVVEFVVDKKWLCKAAMDEIPSVVRSVANSVLQAFSR